MPTLKNTASSEEAGYLGEGGTGVYGRNIFPKGNGVIGSSEGGRGVWGHSKTGDGVVGESEQSMGVTGRSQSNAGVLGEGGTGVYGRNVTGNGNGVIGYSDDGRGVWGHSKTGYGVLGESANDEGVRAVTNSAATAAMAAYNNSEEGTGAAIFAQKKGSKGHAGFFDGDVYVTRTLGVGIDIILANGDAAEDFDVSGSDKVEPGTVMVLGDEGALSESQQAYDKRVAGVISGAGDYKPGIVLDKQQTLSNRQPIALMGKVFCKVDAQFGAIEVGDLLTTSPTPGHAMKTNDPFKAFGAVIGKALRPLTDGAGLIPILIALQ